MNSETSSSAPIVAVVDLTRPPLETLTYSVTETARVLGVSLPELAGHLDIGRARRRIAGRVIADAGDAGRTMLDCTPEHLSWMCQ